MLSSQNLSVNAFAANLAVVVVANIIISHKLFGNQSTG